MLKPFISFHQFLTFSIILIIPVLGFSQQIGDTLTAGHTWYENQYHGCPANLIQSDSEGNIPMIWMNSLNSGSSQRHIFYNCWTETTGLFWPGGVQVDMSPRAGYGDLDIFSDDRIAIAFHQYNPLSSVDQAVIGLEFAGGTGAFLTYPLPPVIDPVTQQELEVIWPRLAIDIDDRMHTITIENPYGWELPRIYYCRAVENISGQLEFETPERLLVDSNYISSADIASSPVSNRVAIGIFQFGATTGDTTGYDNDLIIIRSNDGTNWDFADTLNVTNWIPPDPSLLPDTAAANRDSLRCTNDMHLFFDQDDALHVVFTTRGFYYYNEYGQPVINHNGYIWHWDERNEVFSLVANGWFENFYLNLDYWDHVLQSGTVSIDPLTGDMHCLYRRNFIPVDTSSTLPFPYLIGDTTQVSAAGYPGADIFVTKSIDGGLSWSEGINITNTVTPYLGLPGDCRNEMCPSVSPYSSDGYLNTFYVLDYDCGNVVQGGGEWTLNDAIYQRIPLVEIPNTPLLPPYPMHCDSTGMPPVTIVNETSSPTPSQCILHPAYPNPFNAKTAISFKLQAPGKVELKVYDITGREVQSLLTGHLSLGEHSVVWNAKDCASGIYFAKLSSSRSHKTVKLLLLK